MMDCTDRHERYFLRLLSKKVMLYTEMVATKSAIHGDRKKILYFNKVEKPLGLQVGGSDKKELSLVSKIAEDLGYDEININLGCPSKKVQKNKFGACLIKEPDENLEEEEVEEISNDDFEKQYKGEVSKSGVAILPSKRMRKIPFNTSVSTKDKVSKEKEKPLELIEEAEEKK